MRNNSPVDGSECSQVRRQGSAYSFFAQALSHVAWARAWAWRRERSGCQSDSSVRVKGDQKVPVAARAGLARGSLSDLEQKRYSEASRSEPRILTLTKKE